jgi:hypothetical protein
MTSDYLKRTRSLDEVYALIDKNRFEAAKVARAKFHNEMEAAIATIASIGSIASARVLADSRVASANVLIDAELVASRLLAEAEMQASRCAKEVLTKPKEVVEASLLEIGKQMTLQLVVTAKGAVDKIQQDADSAIKVLRETGAIAIREVQALATSVTDQTKRDAELAAARLAEYRKQSRTVEEASADSEDLAMAVLQAAEEVSAQLRVAIEATMEKINTVTNNACSAIQEAAVAAKMRVEHGREQALLRLTEAIKVYL